MSIPLGFDYVKEMYALAINIQRAKNVVYALRLFELVAESGDPFYTPFALAGLSQCYAELGHRDLEGATLRRVTQLPKEQQRLLNPGWLAFCYQRSDEFKAAANIHTEILKLAPHESSSKAALAEISLLDGDFDQAERIALELQKLAEPRLQILGRMIRALLFALRNKHDEAARELSWVGQFLLSSGNVPVGTWDYRDVQPVIARSGPSAKAFEALVDVLSGKIALTEFAPTWAQIMPPLQTKA